MNHIIPKENVETLLDKKFLRMYDLHYAEGKHYFDASRRLPDDLLAVKSDEDFKKSLPDAVTCIVEVSLPGEEPKLLLTREHRYVVGRFLLSPPAGLVDAADAKTGNAILTTAKREIFEETGVTIDINDAYIVNPLLLSSPGMTDESNAFVYAKVNLPDLSCLTQEGAEGSELFDGFVLLTRDEARDILLSGTDPDGFWFSGATWIVLMCFVSELWNKR